MALACDWNPEYTMKAFEQSIDDCSLESIRIYSQKIHDFLKTIKKE
ncbi:MAG: hypothetical protein ACRC0G_16095 [Fusobacteriaceae bacterium]